jgi:hypothetical protein
MVTNAISSKRLLSERGLQSCCAVQTTIANRRLGAMFLGSERPCPCWDEEVRLLSFVGDRVAIAVDHVLSQESRDDQGRSDNLCSEIVPRINKSNGTERSGRITKRGTKLGRTTHVQRALIAHRYSDTTRGGPSRPSENAWARVSIERTTAISGLIGFCSTFLEAPERSCPRRTRGALR